MTIAKRIIPCLDIDNGRVVKGVQFKNIKDAGDPVEIAKRYNQEGADEITFLDITASSDERNIMIDLVQQVAAQVFIPMTVGGGIRKVSDIAKLHRAGADKIAINTAAVQNPELVKQASETVGSQCIVVAIDARRYDDKKEAWQVFTHGGRTPCAIDAVEWAQQMEANGAGEILLTSMDRDGTHDGFDLQLTHKISTSVGIPVIASGGVGTLDHLVEGIVKGKADAVLAASIFHFQKHTILEAKQYLSQHNICVRIDS